MKANETTAKRRQQLLRFISRDLLGPVVGKMPKSSIESLEKASYFPNVRRHILDIVPMTDARIVKHEPRTAYPPFIRTEAVFNRRNLYLLKDATVSPFSGLAWIGNRIIEESVGSLRRIMDWGDVLHEPLLPVTTLSNAEPVVVCHPASYFHWLMEVLPNLLFAVDKFPEVKIALPEEVPRYVSEGLSAALGPDAEKRFIRCPGPVRVERLVVPQYHTQPEFTDPQAIALLHSAVKGKTVADGAGGARAGRGVKLYVSRGKSRRRLAGEELLEHRLEKIGFTILHSENLSFAEQIRAFHEAETVVGTHGAGLTNVVWSQPGCRVIEIFANNYVLDCYAWLSFSRGLEYRHVVCDTGHRIDEEAMEEVLRMCG